MASPKQGTGPQPLAVLTKNIAIAQEGQLVSKDTRTATALQKNGSRKPVQHTRPPRRTKQNPRTHLQMAVNMVRLPATSKEEIPHPRIQMVPQSSHRRQHRTSLRAILHEPRARPAAQQAQSLNLGNLYMLATNTLSR